MRPYIAGCRPVGIPNVITHSHAVQEIASAQPSRYNHPPCAIRNDLPDANTLMPDSPCKLVVVGHGSLRFYGTGCGSGFVTGCVGLGVLFGGGGVTGSFVGDTGSSSGMTVYLVTGSPI